MLDEVSSLSHKITLDVVDFYGNQQDARDRGVDKIPAIVVGSNGADNVRFYGLPAGFEFSVLLDTIVSASDNRSTLSLETRKRLRRLSEAVHIQVYMGSWHRDRGGTTIPHRFLQESNHRPPISAACHIQWRGSSL